MLESSHKYFAKTILEFSRAFCCKRRNKTASTTTSFAEMSDEGHSKLSDSKSNEAQNEQVTQPKEPDSSTVEAAAAPLSFSQIRQRFEERCKPKVKLVIVKQSSTLVNIPKPEEKVPSEFQKLYPSFKEFFSKSQFAAIETSFGMADENQDGFLEPKEVKQLMSDCQQAINLCDADVIVSIGDQDQDGKLSPKEFLELCKPSAEILREHHHMEGSRPPSNVDFVQTILQKLRNFAAPVNSRVKGTRQFFENIIYSRTNTSINNKDVNSPLPKKLSSKRYMPHSRPWQKDENEVGKCVTGSSE